MRRRQRSVRRRAWGRRRRRPSRGGLSERVRSDRQVRGWQREEVSQHAPGRWTLGRGATDRDTARLYGHGRSGARRVVKSVRRAVADERDRERTPETAARARARRPLCDSRQTASRSQETPGESVSFRSYTHTGGASGRSLWLTLRRRDIALGCDGSGRERDEREGCGGGSGGGGGGRERQHDYSRVRT